MSKPKILVLFYSMYGHIYEMTKAAVEGIEAAGGEAVVMKVQELVPEEYLDDFAKKTRDSLKDIPTADPRKDLKGIDGIMVGTPTRFGNMVAQMRNFWDQTGGDWQEGTLIGKPAAVFTSTATQHGGQETTIVTTMLTLIHQGMVIVGLPYSNQEQMTIDEITGGSPYGASTIAGGQGQRMPSENEKILVRAQARYLTETAKKLMK